MAPPSRPNLVLITAEALRADRLGCYRGREASATPNIDSLAAEGRLFEQVLTPAASSVPAVASLLTGRTPFETKVWDDDYRNRLAPGSFTLARRLRKEGYRTGGFVATSRLAAGRGFDQGFDLYRDGYRVPPTGIWRLFQGLGTRMVPAAKSWLEGGRGPYFLWMHFIEPTIPAVPSQTQPQAGADAANYARRVSQLDEVVGEVLTLLKDRGEYESSVVVLTADHGMGLGEHGEWRSGLFVYDSTVRVPLIIKTLAGDGRKGSRTPDLAGLVDVFPTAERLLGLGATSGLPGRDLLAPPPASRPVYTSAALLGQEVFGWKGQELVASGSRRLISGAATELYDVASDPAEVKDLSASASSEAASLREQGRRAAGGMQVPPPHFQPEKGLPRDLAGPLAKMGLAPPSPEKARARALPDPREFLSTLRVLEYGDAGVGLIGVSAIAGARDRLLKEAPESLFTLVSVAALDISRSAGSPEGLAGAEALLKTAQAIYPLEPEVYHLLAHVAAARERQADAETLLRAALSLSPRFPAEVTYDLACACAKQGRRKEAIAELRRSIRLGFRDSGHIGSDPDLDRLRQEPGYKRLMEEEFPSAPSS